MTAAGLNFFAFDVIGSLAFGRPFGMVSAGRDVAPVSTPASTSGTTSSSQIEHLPAIEILNRRGEYSATMGCIPPLLRPLAKKLPWFFRGLESVRKLAGIAIAAVGTRMELEESGEGADSRDLLSKLMKGKDENGNPMGREELTAEALTQLIAGEFRIHERVIEKMVVSDLPSQLCWPGSDTTSNSSCAILYYLSNNPRVVTKLLSELAPVAETKEPGFVSFSFEDVKDLPYLQACIDEALRLHSTSAIGLPRIVPEGGAVVCDEFFPEGMTLSVPVSW
jgi:benzoate 4-monooxygenase